MPKYRKGKLKVEHHLVEGAEDYLRTLERFQSVEAIIPGRIFRNQKGRGQKGLFLKYETPSGWKLLFKNGSTVQEVFVITNDRELFKAEFQTAFGSEKGKS
ncbi:MAG: hypothetical protein GXO08_00740 [Aquificae bacterium]|nr:hypothetical protein [Aquificota bacterium]